MADTASDTAPQLTLIVLWTRIAQGEERYSSVVERVLKSRNQMSDQAHQALTAAINSAVRDVPGFSKNPAMAPPSFLAEPVMHEMIRSEKLAGAVLRVWAESHKDLHDAVVGHLESIGAPAEYPNFKEGLLRGLWPPDDWERELEGLADKCGEFDKDDVALMLCYTSGKVPDRSDGEDDEQYVDFPGWLACMKGLPANAEEWAGAREFITAAAKVIEEKEAERSLARVRELDGAIADLAERFSPELIYLERGADSWSADGLPASVIPQALDSVHELGSALDEYRPVRELAPVISQELVRAEERRAFESRILALMDKVDRLMSETDTPDGDTPAEQDVEGPPDGGRDPRSEPARAEAEEGQPAEAVARQTDGALLNENEDLRQEVRSLKEELKESRHKEEGWRLSYVEAVRGRMDQDGEGEVPPVRDVASAVDLARDLFTGELLFQLNSRSEVRNNPFEDPEAVLGALKWLATTYRRSRRGDGSLPDPDSSIREACGWSYTSHQSEVTMGMYKEWYVTKVDGETRRLREHVGKGNSKDARHTIRIGFDWDKERQAVVIGFIGRHQRTTAT